MRLLRWEMGRLFRLPALWVFLALCLGFNGFLMAVSGDGRAAFRFASETAAALGQQVDEGFLRALGQRADSPERDALLAAASGLEDPLETYDTAALAQRYGILLEHSAAERWMEGKYRRLSAQVERLARENAAMNLYAGPATDESHDFLFGTLLHAVQAEACLLAVLAALYLPGRETAARTEGLVYSTRTGRRLRSRKALAALLAGLLLELLLLIPTLGVYFCLWDYGGVWSASVSSQFHSVREVFGVKPFLTWTSFSVAGYLAATLLLGLALTAVFSLLASCCAALVRNTYAAALAVTALCVAMPAAALACSDLDLWPLYYAATLQPVLLWLLQGGWFTDLGINAVLPWHETVGTAFNLLLWGGALLLALRHGAGKDLI